MNTAQSQGEILIVDDDQALRETLADFFEMEGYSILQAANAAD